MAPTKTPRTIKPLRVPVAEKPHPSRGGRAYSRDVRAIVSAAPNVLPIIPGVTPSERTRRRWNQRLYQEGHNREYERRGNKRPGALVGSDKWLLLLLRSAFPKATAAEATAFIYRNTLNHIPRIFSPSQITAAEYSLGLTRKRSSNGGVRTILMDNLSAHRSLIVQQTVMATGQQLLYRRKYSPVDAPIEYVFNTCQSELHIRMREINLLNIVYLIIDIISNMNGFANYFVFCGY